jgi:hypothetical protein
MTERNSHPEMTSSEPSPNERCVHIPDRIGAAIEKRLPATNFDTTDEYVSVVLESLLRELDQQADDPTIDPVEQDDPEDSGQLEERLESLGYL